MSYAIEYDGPSLPILVVGKGMFRVQMFTSHGWITFINEEEYHELIAALKEEEDDRN